LTKSVKKLVVAAVPAANRRVVYAVVLIVLAATLAYSDSFRGVLVFDDLVSVTQNPTIENLWSPDIFCPPPSGAPVQGRPVANASLAVSYALDHTLQFKDYPLFGYHLVNLLIHILAGLTLFGIVRRTLMLERMGDTFRGAATPLALTVAILWTLHPLQTESVTYIVQRTESLMGLFYLFTLYCVIRAATRVDMLPESARRPSLAAASGGGGPGCPPPIADGLWSRASWTVAAVLACAAGMASKEVMVTAPVLILLYDRIFLTGSWRETFRRRWPCHLAMACTWAIVILLALGAGSRNNTAGFGVAGLLSPLQYALNEPNVIVRYLRLAMAPVGLCLDYHWNPAASTAGLLPGLLVVGILLAASVWAILRGSAWGFLGAWFFLILSPTSSIMPVADLAFEHRMYLPLAGVIAAATVGVYLLARSRVSRRALGMLVLAAAVILGALTYQRNEDYRSTMAIWRDALETNPDNPRAHLVIAQELSRDPLRAEEAQEHYRKALLKDANDQNKIDLVKGYSNRGLMYLHQGKYSLAAEDLSKAVEMGPYLWVAWGNLAYAHMELGQYPQAIREATRAIELNPNGELTPAIYDTRGQTYCRMGNYARAISDLTAAIAASKKPHPELYNNRARIYLKSNQPGKARADADQCTRMGGKLDPDVQQALGTHTQP
jgi:tetratricopeptide (TPR) repeat protein